MSASATLRTKATSHFGGATSRKLIGLTNMTNDNSPNTIDDVVLLSHCDLAIGRFAMETGHTADPDNASHLFVLMLCLVSSLEFAKGRDSAIAMGAERQAVNALISFRKKSRGFVYSSSSLKPSTEQVNSLPDSDRLQGAFQPSKTVGVGSRNKLREVNN